MAGLEIVLKRFEQLEVAEGLGQVEERVLWCEVVLQGGGENEVCGGDGVDDVEEGMSSEGDDMEWTEVRLDD